VFRVSKPPITQAKVGALGALKRKITYGHKKPLFREVRTGVWFS
jgi:hypothetical protein